MCDREREDPKFCLDAPYVKASRPRPPLPRARRARSMTFCVLIVICFVLIVIVCNLVRNLPRVRHDLANLNERQFQA